MKYKAVIFDLDGTLVHTMPEYRYSIVGRTLQDLNGKRKKEHIDKFWFGSNRNTIIKNNFKIEPSLFWKTYEKYDKEKIRERFTRAYDDAGIVKEIKKQGIATGIVTGAPRHIASLEIKMIGRKNFDSVILAHEAHGLKQKPHPAALRKCLEELDVTSKDALYVGNANEDIIMAQKAKVMDVLIKRGEHTVREAKPTLSITTLNGLRKIIQ